jgi:hypothetical protein
MIIYRVDTSAITGVNDSLCCLRVDGLTLHIVTNKGVKPTATSSLRSPAHAESSMHHWFSIVNAYREMVLRGSPTARAHNNMLFPTLDALARPTSGRSVTRANLGERRVRLESGNADGRILLLIRTQSRCRAATHKADQAALLSLPVTVVVQDEGRDIAFIPKVFKPRKYQAVHDVPCPYHPWPEATPIISREDFLCVWGTPTTPSDTP